MMRIRTSARTAMIQALITDAGAGAKAKLYNGAFPAALGTPAGTLLATLTFGSTIGSASAGVLDWDEAGATQSNGSHVAGTPTFLRITTSADVAVWDIEINTTGSPVAGKMDFSGTVATGQNVTLSALTLTAGNT